MYPTTEMSNPRAGNGQDATIRVYSVCTEGDVKDAACNVLHPRENTGEFREQFQRLCNNFQLNTLEAERILRCIVKQDWCLIKGTWDLFRNSVTIPHGDAQWTVRVDALIQRIMTHC